MPYAALVPNVTIQETLPPPAGAHDHYSAATRIETLPETVLTALRDGNDEGFRIAYRDHVSKETAPATAERFDAPRSRPAPPRRSEVARRTLVALALAALGVGSAAFTMLLTS
jgi:hypothetical protein